MKTVKDFYLLARDNANDLNEHLDTIKEYASQCKTAVEFGTKLGRSASAIMLSGVKKFKSYDIEHFKIAEKVFQMAVELPNIDCEYIIQNDLEVLLEPTDMLFIDTFHTYKQLGMELKIHAPSIKKFILMHDTTTFGEDSEDGTSPGLNEAIKEFLDANKYWKVREIFTHNNGLTVLERITK